MVAHSFPSDLPHVEVSKEKELIESAKGRPFESGIEYFAFVCHPLLVLVIVASLWLLDGGLRGKKKWAIRTYVQ